MRVGAFIPIEPVLGTGRVKLACSVLHTRRLCVEGLPYRSNLGTENAIVPSYTRGGTHSDPLKTSMKTPTCHVYRSFCPPPKQVAEHLVSVPIN